MYIPLWEKIHNLTHYRRAALVGLALSMTFIIYFWFTGLPPELRFVENPLIEIFSIVSFYAHMLSSPTYIGGTIDLFKKPNPENTIERWITLIGILLGLTAAIILIWSLPSVTFFSVISTSASMVGSFAGIFSRLGTLCTSWSSAKKRPLLEQVAILFFTCAGIVLSLCILVSHAPIIHIAGVISFMTGAPTISHGVGSSLFVCIFTSTCMSGAEYLSKGGVFVLYLFFDYSKEHVEARYHEYQGTFIACVLSGVACLLLMLNFSVLAGTAFAAPGIMLMIATSTVLTAKCFGIDGTWSRFGRALDELFEGENNTFLEKVAIVLFVFLGGAGVIVILDMGYQGIKKLFISQDPLPQPVSGSQSTLKPLSSPLETTSSPITGRSPQKLFAHSPAPRSPRQSDPDLATGTSSDSPPNSAESLSPKSSPSPRSDRDRKSAEELPHLSMLNSCNPLPSPRSETLVSSFQLSCCAVS